MSDIWYLLQDHRRYVYHYTRADTALEYILPTNKLKFSTFDGLNDPVEFKRVDLSFRNYSSGLDEQFPKLKERIERALRSRWRVACFCRDSEDAAFDSPDLTPDELNTKPPNRGHSRANLWAHYAENHAGVCLVFDMPKLIESVKEYAGQNLAFVAAYVQYALGASVISPFQASPHSISLSDLEQLGADGLAARHVEQYLPQLFLTKTPDWAVEREVRFLLGGCNDDGQPHFVNIGDALCGIAFGCRIDASKREKIARLAHRRNISLADMEWRNGFPQPQPAAWLRT